jgi:hypothetical protein
MPIEYTKLNHEFIHPLDFHQNKVLKFVLRKQLHVCQLKRRYKNLKHCKYGFPYDINLDSPTKVNRITNRWEYFWPRHCDWIVIPYHFILLLIWGAQLNIQRILSSFWSYLEIHYESSTTWHLEHTHYKCQTTRLTKCQ